MLEDAGLPLDGLGEALNRGLVSLDFIDTTSNNRWGSLTATTFEDLSQQIGVPIELLAAIREAMGFAPPDPSDRIQEHEMEVVPLVQLGTTSAARSTSQPGSPTTHGLVRWW